VPLERWLPDELMQSIAMENNVAETAFFVPGGESEDADYQLRWFTPAIEVDLCGHATLATGHVLRSHLGVDFDSVTFSSRSGPLRVKSGGDLLQLDFPAMPGGPVDVSQEIVDAMGREPEALIEARGGGNNALRFMAILPSESDVCALTPDITKISAIGTGCLIVTAPGDDVDFVSRFFAPGAGVDEDPVTGSAHCMLTPYWAERLGKTMLRARQVSLRGGELFCEQDGDRVLIGGRAVTYFEGVLSLES
jgi:PhzF family phenazine biosynthesis protein